MFLQHHASNVLLTFLCFPDSLRLLKSGAASPNYFDLSQTEITLVPDSNPVFAWTVQRLPHSGGDFTAADRRGI
jgi:hypothetical protein